MVEGRLEKEVGNRRKNITQEIIFSNFKDVKDLN